jgi:DNA-binding transcriptional LysR family regulator
MVQALAEGFAAALADIISSWDWLELVLQVADSHTVSEKVRQADLDFGLILDPEGQAGLSVLAFVELEMGIVMRPDNPWRMRPRALWGAQPAAPYRPRRAVDDSRTRWHALSPL